MATARPVDQRGIGGVDVRANVRWGILAEREDWAKVGHDRARERQPVRLGARVRLLVRKDAPSKRFELDHPEDPLPLPLPAIGGVDKSVTVDMETGTRFPVQDAVREPLSEEGGRPRVL